MLDSRESKVIRYADGFVRKDGPWVKYSDYLALKKRETIYREALEQIARASTDYFESEMADEIIWCRNTAKAALNAGKESGKTDI